MGRVEGGVVQLFFGEGADIPSGTLHLLLERDAEMNLQQRGKGELPKTQERCGAVGIEDIPEGKGVVPLQDPDVVVAGVEDLKDVRIDQDVAEKGEVKSGQWIDQPGPLPRLDLEEAELVPEVAEGVVLRIEGDDRRGAD